MKKTYYFVSYDRGTDELLNSGILKLELTEETVKKYKDGKVITNLPTSGILFDNSISAYSWIDAWRSQERRTPEWYEIMKRGYN